MALNNKFDDAEEQVESNYRKDINASCFRDVHNRFYPKIYDYSFCQERNQERAIQLTNSYFVEMAKTITEMEQPEEVVRGMSSRVLDARKARKTN